MIFSSNSIKHSIKQIENIKHTKAIMSRNTNAPIIISTDVKVQNANEKKVSLQYPFELEFVNVSVIFVVFVICVVWKTKIFPISIKNE